MRRLVRPFLKWAGNKYQIVEQIRGVLPAGKRLIEPFVGSGAVFLNTTYPAYLLSDANPDLIGLYQVLQAEGAGFIEHCRTFFRPENNEGEVFYRLRSRFNATTDPREKAALFVYLNRHCYNGLCRYNLSGQFNVPFGRYRKPYFPEEEMGNFARQSARAVFVQADFSGLMEAAEPGDVVYCDPPYVPLSDTARFTAYSSGGFGAEEQKRLARLAEKLAARGILVVVSNHDTAFTRREYAQAQVTALAVQRYISCDGAKRGKVGELLAVFGGNPGP
jgi:DNA adenine methylase